MAMARLPEPTPISTNARLVHRLGKLQAFDDDVLAIGPRDQHRRRDLQLQSVKFLAPDQIRHRAAFQPLADQIAKLLPNLRRDAISLKRMPYRSMRLQPTAWASSTSASRRAVSIVLGGEMLGGPIEQVRRASRLFRRRWTWWYPRYAFFSGWSSVGVEAPLAEDVRGTISLLRAMRDWINDRTQPDFSISPTILVNSS